MSFYEEERELRCVLSWFSNWEAPQKEQFLHILVEKAVPPDVDQLFQGFDQLNLNSSFQSVLQCQLRLFSQWFDSWPCKYRNLLLMSLELQDPGFVGNFHTLVNQKTGSSQQQ
ncbi:hypothetical protein SK128_001562 [Halocaridina rubra]|uniref:Uncharacterized protein n=1 Tax=Halocaridina rubra TaxID=373956 RepID=A0AAN8XCT8_HALRR